MVHGVPSDKEILKTGDIITIDLGIKYQGYFVENT
ncbi:MAG: M24 family metallopeptidase [Candidatus Phytoplasma australasiaticum]|nr:M24 family metallopeptidase [Candidatus Phytoplasma australasiaticum]